MADSEGLIAEIGQGLLIYLGIGPADDEAAAYHLAGRLANMRIFSDSVGRMNRSLLDVSAAALVVSQFTLFADLSHGHRPSFSAAGGPERARELCSLTVSALRLAGVNQVSEGRFGSHMQVESNNDGPVTIVVSSAEGPWQANCG